METRIDVFEIEETCRRAWLYSPATRRAFGDSFERFLAFSMAEAQGRVQISRNKLEVE